MHAVDATLRTVSAVHGPATGLPHAAGGDHRRRDRQRAVERAAGLPGPVRRRAGLPRFRRPGLRGGAGDGLAGRHLLAAGRPGRRRAGLLPARVRLPAPPRPAAARAARVRRRRPEHPLAVLLRQPRGAQPGRRHPDPGARRRADRRQEAVSACPRTSITTGRSRSSPSAPRRSWRAPTARSRPIPSAARSPGGTSSTPTCGPAHGRSATDSPSGTGWTAPLTTSTTRPRCGSSRSTPTAWPAARPGAWTPSRPAGWKPGWPRCTPPTAGPTAARSGPATTTGW